MRLRLNDDTILENASAGYADGALWITLTGMTLQEAASIFFDTGKTAVIVVEYTDTEDRYEGFTNCVNLWIDSDGIVRICMVRG